VCVCDGERREGRRRSYLVISRSKKKAPFPCGPRTSGA
jgi:hypothetical protein